MFPHPPPPPQVGQNFTVPPPPPPPTLPTSRFAQNMFGLSGLRNLAVSREPQDIVRRDNSLPLYTRVPPPPVPKPQQVTKAPVVRGLEACLKDPKENIGFKARCELPAAMKAEKELDINPSLTAVYCSDGIEDVVYVPAADHKYKRLQMSEDSESPKSSTAKSPQADLSSSGRSPKSAKPRRDKTVGTPKSVKSPKYGGTSKSAIPVQSDATTSPAVSPKVTSWSRVTAVRSNERLRGPVTRSSLTPPPPPAEETAMPESSFTSLEFSNFHRGPKIDPRWPVANQVFLGPIPLSISWDDIRNAFYSKVNSFTECSKPSSLLNCRSRGRNYCIFTCRVSQSMM